MPELPEVETTRLGVIPHVKNQRILNVILRRADLRLPVSAEISSLAGHEIRDVTRRAKYLLFTTDSTQSFIIHLGMSGSLRICTPQEAWKTHDHVAWNLANGRQMRYYDPRRFGLVIHLNEGNPLEHKWLRTLGPEPLSASFCAEYLASECANRKIPIKQAIMNNHIVVGVGNIYASEALFLAKISPLRVANSLTLLEHSNLVKAIREVLAAAIAQGGTTLRDFVNSDGKPGYFSQQLNVYGRKNLPCRVCDGIILNQVLAQRMTFWCQKCQK